MLIKCNLNLIVASYDVGDAFVGSQVEIDILPCLPHALEHHLNVVLLTGSLAYINAQLNVLNQTHVQTLLEAETLDIWVDCKANSIRYGFPVSLLHTLFA